MHFHFVASVSQVLDFSSTLFLDSVTGAMKRKSNKSGCNFLVYLTVFDRETWSVVLTTLMTLAFSFCCFGYILTRTKLEGEATNGFIVVPCLLIQLDTPYSYTNIGSRVLYFASALFTTVIFASYTADLTTSMTVPSPKVQIRSFKDMAKTEYKINFFKDAAPFTAMSTAKDETGIKQMYTARVENSLPSKYPKTYAEAAQMIVVYIV